MLQCLPNQAFRDKGRLVRETGGMRKTIERFALPGIPPLPVAGALGFLAVGAGFALGFGVGLSRGIATAMSRSAPATGQDELASLRTDRIHHAERASRLDHDMRTPIGTMATALEWMNTTLDEPDSQAEARQVIGRQVNRMIALTEELHELAQQLGS